MNYVLLYNVSVLIFILQSIAGNEHMINQSFRAVVILGFMSTLSLLSKKSQ
jgi:hypothetical protein